jgi:hypothetical protein
MGRVAHSATSRQIFEKRSAQMRYRKIRIAQIDEASVRRACLVGLSSLGGGGGV